MKPPILIYLILLFTACQSSPKIAPDGSASEVSATDENKPTLNNSKLKTPQLETTIPKPTFVSVRDSGYVSAPSGLRVRNAPSLEGERIGVRPFGKKVRIIERTRIELVVKDNGKDLTGEWVGIESRLLQDGALATVTGYVFDGFLVKTKAAIKTAIPKDIKIEKLQTVFNQNAGIGGLMLNRENLVRADRENFTIPLYGKNRKGIIGHVSNTFFRNGNYRRYSNFKHPEDCKYTDPPRMSASSELGLGDFIRVYDRKDDFLFLGYICHQAVWVRTSDLDPEKVKFENYLNIFKSLPKGGGWEAGYTYTGANKVLRESPDLNAKPILNNILPDYEIYLLGEYKGHWAKVKIREARHKFGEMYFSGTDYGRDWEGWIMIVDPDGTMLMAPHIFGC